MGRRSAAPDLLKLDPGAGHHAGRRYAVCGRLLQQLEPAQPALRPAQDRPTAATKSACRPAWAASSTSSPAAAGPRWKSTAKTSQIANRKADLATTPRNRQPGAGLGRPERLAAAQKAHRHAAGARAERAALPCRSWAGSGACWLYLPADYAANPARRYPVLYLHDGQNVFDDATSFSGEWGVDETLDRLRQAGQDATGSIVVAVDNGDAVPLRRIHSLAQRGPERPAAPGRAGRRLRRFPGPHAQALRRCPLPHPARCGPYRHRRLQPGRPDFGVCGPEIPAGVWAKWGRFRRPSGCATTRCGPMRKRTRRRARRGFTSCAAPRSRKPCCR